MGTSVTCITQIYASPACSSQSCLFLLCMAQKKEIRISSHIALTLPYLQSRQEMEGCHQLVFLGWEEPVQINCNPQPTRGLSELRSSPLPCPTRTPILPAAAAPTESRGTAFVGKALSSSSNTCRCLPLRGSFPCSAAPPCSRREESSLHSTQKVTAVRALVATRSETEDRRKILVRDGALQPLACQANPSISAGVVLNFSIVCRIQYFLQSCPRSPFSAYLHSLSQLFTQLNPRDIYCILCLNLSVSIAPRTAFQQPSTCPAPAQPHP